MSSESLAGTAESPSTFSHSIAFVMRFGEALHTYGVPAHRLEEAMTLLSRRLGMEAHFVSTPTSITASFAARGERSHRIVRIHRSGVDLGRLAELDEVSNQVVRHEKTPAQALARVEEIVSARPRYGSFPTIVAYGSGSGAAACVFGGGWPETLTATTMGLAIGLLSLLVRGRPAEGVFEPVAAFVGTLLAGIGGGLFHVSVPVATLAGLIVLLPGLSLTSAMTELATRNLVSGTARLTGALFVFLTIGFGVALGSRTAALVFGEMVSVVPRAFPPWAQAVALAVEGVTFSVLFRAHRRDLAYIVAACGLAFGGARTGAYLLGPELGIFLGALAVGVASNLYARVAERPAVVPLVPGIMLLVPGSLGFRSFRSLFARDFQSGMELASSVALVGVSLVSGLLLANVLYSPRRPL